MQRNDIEISETTRAKTEGARQALLALRKTFQHWVMIGDAIVALRARAEELGGRKTFHRLLEQQGLGTFVQSKAVTSRLEKIMAHLPDVQEWHGKLSDKQQIEWSSPGSVLNHCPVFAKAKTSGAQGKTKPTPSTAVTLTKEVDRLQAAYDEVKEENESLREKLKSAQARIRELESGQTKTDKPVKAKAKPTTDNITSDGELKWDGEGVYSAWVGYGATDSTKGAYYNICQPLTMAFGGGGSVKQSKKWSVSLSHNSLRYCHFSKDAPTAEKAKELAQQDWARRGQLKENLKWNDREAKAATVGMYVIGDPPLYHGKKQKGCVVSFKPNGGAVQHVGHFRTPSKAREFAQIDWQLRG